MRPEAVDDVENELVRRISEPDVVDSLAACDDAGRRTSLLRGHLAGLDRPTVDALLTQLKAEAERFLTLDVGVSLRLADALVAGAEIASWPEHHALGLMAKGDALRVLGRYAESRDLLDEAATIFASLGDEVGWARTRIGWLESSLFLGHGVEALGVVDRATEILASGRQWLRAGGVNVNAGFVSRVLGRYDEALRFYDRAIGYFERAGEDPALRDVSEIRSAKARANQAIIIALRGEFRQALAMHEAARETWDRHRENILVVRQDQYIASAYAGQGHYTRALRIYGDVFTGLLRAGLELEAWRAALNMVECYLGLNQSASALDLATEAIERLDALASPVDAARARFYCGVAMARAGDLERAWVLLDEAALGFSASGFDDDLGLAALQRARLDLARQDWAAAARDAERACDVFARRGARVRQAEASLVQARALVDLGRHDEATDLATTALAVAGEREILWLAHEAHHLRAGVARARGDRVAALAECRAAVASVERLQSRLAPELRVNFLEDKLPIFQETIDLCLELGNPRLALGYLERAKSRALVDYLVANPEVRLRSPDAASQELLDELARLREEHHALYDRLYGYHPPAHGETDAPADPMTAGARRLEAGALNAALIDREKQIGRVLEQLALRRDDGAAVPFAPMDEGELPWPALDDDTVLVEYYLSPDRAAAFVIRGDRLEVVGLSAGPIDVRRLLDRWQLNLDATARAIGGGGSTRGLERNARGILESFYQALLAPLERVLGGSKRLIVIPFGPTHGVPFHALHDGERFLVERLEVSVCPSLRLLDLCARRGRRNGLSALVVAHSDGGRLSGALAEARAIARLFPGAHYLESDATRGALTANAARYPVVHLAAHGEARPDNPAFAHLKLADGQLSAVDVFGLELDGALVTLSGCETGRCVVAGGDELIGLSRGFLHAGASTLIQSLWRVEDDSTARLMESFYHALRAGRTKGAALREAQLGLLAEQAAQPYLWAPFQLVGAADHGLSD